MPVKRIDVKQEHLFPFNFRLFGQILLAAGPLIFSTQALHWWIIIISILLPIIGLVVVDTRYGLQIDTKKKTYKIYTQLLGLRFGKNSTYTAVEKIFINKVRTSTIITSWAGLQRDHKSYSYKAFIKFSNGVKVHLDTDRDFEKLQLRVDRYQKILINDNISLAGE